MPMSSTRVCVCHFIVSTSYLYPGFQAKTCDHVYPKWPPEDGRFWPQVVVRWRDGKYPGYLPSADLSVTWGPDEDDLEPWCERDGRSRCRFR